MSRSGWSVQEDAAIQHLVSPADVTAGNASWSGIASALNAQLVGPPRTGKQVRTRWMNHLDPAISRQDWTEEEECMLYDAHAKHGNKWATIAALLPGRYV